ncbi:DUF808 domain-containing protein [Aestuariirhabdus sp. Z084]|uniref:DUF808 domain-containing protein n=1 Tax=Aestuariirhabdus haliotis TaxID=2918751 RepID=UPI00201B36BB|nr:DUF808 domain-containing protein [Aestuariirhabdus haliotis]MCL6417212.1 DUF808 domain-containing protein [Aestuariirhabdus haliotis]MCL6421184.1 DUF808 domain-containing protein [Aestuariirhabdus haliotis]
MAGVGLLALLDDIAALLDDVAMMTKVAARKTAGVLGDDLALNAEQVSGIRAERELPVVWAVAKGSAKNKCILVPAALLISAVAPWLITPLLMLGGAFLCYEGFEKVAHKLLAHDADEARQEKLKALADPAVDMVEFEAKKIKGAIRTDFILSAEIIVIALGVVQELGLATQIGVVVSIAVLVTVGVYGVVAGIVKLDDAGLYLMANKSLGFQGDVVRSLGRGILSCCPYVLKTLTLVGTAAMFLVGGGILVHGLPGSHAVVHYVEQLAASLPVASGFISAITPILVDGLVGIVAGGLLVLAGLLSQKAVQAVKG